MTSARAQTIPDHLAYAAERFLEDLAYVEGERRVTWSELHGLASEPPPASPRSAWRRATAPPSAPKTESTGSSSTTPSRRRARRPPSSTSNSPPAEIEAQVRRPGCRILFASQSVLDEITLPACVEHVVSIGDGAALRDLAASGATGRPDLPSRAPVPDDLAAIIHTSGTAGGAKGVMLSHRNLMANCGAILETLEITQDDSALLVLPRHHAMPFIAAIVLPCSVDGAFVIENDLRRIRDRRTSGDGRDRVQVTAVVHPAVETAMAGGVTDEASLQPGPRGSGAPRPASRGLQTRRPHRAQRRAAAQDGPAQGSPRPHRPVLRVRQRPLTGFRRRGEMT